MRGKSKNNLTRLEIPVRSIPMAARPVTLWQDAVVRTAVEQAWKDSKPGVAGGHEEGGFILADSAGNLSVVRWPSGTQKKIELPNHANCKIGGREIVATSHTHPNTGSDFLQEPSETDKCSVRDDPDLKGALYEGEWVISEHRIYLIAPNGQVGAVEDRLKMTAK